ncbi:MAG: TRAP transporter small permease [Clostridiaceae bacterium]|nr:TRAP transporter small permease [Clostridiaceae bacterium]
MAGFFKVYDACIERIIAVLMGFMVVSLFAQVISRYLLSSSIMWTDEIGRYTFIWIVYLGAVVAFKKRTHLVVDIFTQKMPPKLQFYLNLFFQIVIMLFLLLVFIFGVKYSMANMGNPAYSTNVVSLGVAYASVPVGAVLMIVNILRVILEDLKMKGKGVKRQ